VTIYDLLFALFFLGGAVSLIVAGIAALRGRRPHARAILRRLGIATALYFGALILVSALSPQRRIAVGEEQCSDDWCIAVRSVRRDTVRTGIHYVVAFRLSSHARRVAQRERFVGVYLLDRHGKRYGPVAEPGVVPFDTLLAPEQAIVAERRFIVPVSAEPMDLVVAREGAGWFPGCCIIGNQGSLFHRLPVTPLE
jgi:hypothetical protein